MNLYTTTALNGIVLFLTLLTSGEAGQLRLSRKQPPAGLIDPPHLTQAAEAWEDDTSKDLLGSLVVHRRQPPAEADAEQNSTTESPYAPHAPWVPRSTASPIVQELKARIESHRPAMTKNATNILIDESPGEIAEMLFKVWFFMLWEAACVIILVASVSLFRNFTRKVSELDLAQCQLQLFMVCLMVCPFLRPYFAVKNLPIVGVFVVRCIIEGEILMVIANRLPCAAFSLTRRSAEHMLDEGLPPTKDEKRKQEVISKNEAIAQDGALLEKKAASYKGWMMMCTTCRTVINVARLLLNLFEGLEEDRSTKLAYHAANLALLGLAMVFVFSKLMPTAEEGGSGRHRTWITFIDQSWGSHLIFMHVRWLAATLLVIMQVQDLILVAKFGSENVAQMYAACLQIHEVAMASAWMLLLVVRAHVEKVIAGAQDDMPWKQRLYFLFRPPALSPAAVDKPVALTYRVGEKELKTCWEPPEGLEAYEVRSSWRGVLFDTVTTRVRSRYLPVLMLTIALLHAYDALPAHHRALKESDLAESVAFTFVLQLLSLVTSIVLWFVMGLSLLGNNIFVKRRWLWIAVIVFLVDGCHWVARFSRPPPAVDSVDSPWEDEDTLTRLVHLWMYAACIGISVVGAVLALVLILDGEVDSHFYQSERASFRYCATALDGIIARPSADSALVPPILPSRLGSKGTSSWPLAMLSRTGTVMAEAIRSRGAKVQRPALDFPPMLVAGALATLPLVLALTLFVVYSVKVVMYYARIAQLFAMAAIGTADQEAFFETFDVNLDHQLSPREVGLTTVLNLIGMPELTGAMAALWMRVDKNLDGRLNVEEARSFLDHLVAAKEALKAWLGGDIDEASEGLVRALDDDPKDMAVSKEELPPADLALMFEHAAPDLAGQLSSEMSAAWEQADEDSDEKLRADELATLFRLLKARVGELKTATVQVSKELLAGAAMALQGNFTELEELKLPDQLGDAKDDAVARSKAWAQRALAAYRQRKQAIQQQLGRISTQAEEVAAHIRRVVQDISEEGRNATSAARAVFFAALKQLGGQASSQALKVLEATEAVAGKPEAEATAFLEQSSLRAKEVTTEHAGQLVDVEFEKALPEMVQAALPTIQESLSRGLLFLSLLRAEPTDAADTIVEALDGPPSDGKVDLNEMGVEAMLVQVSPAIHDRFAEFLRAMGLEEGALSKEQIATLIMAIKSVVQRQGGDLDNDGKITDADLALAIHGYMSRLLQAEDSCADGQCRSPPVQDDNSTSLLDASQRRPHTAWLPGRKSTSYASTSMLQASSSQSRLRRLMGDGNDEPSMGFPSTFSDGIAIFSDSNLLKEAWMRIVQWATRNFATLSLRRIEWCLYTAEILAMGLALWTLFYTFEAYVRTFEQCQVGDYTFKGGSHMKELSHRPDFSTFYPGMIMSTVIFSQMFTSVMVFILLVLFTSWTVWVYLWHRFKIFVFWLAMGLVLQLVVLRVLVLDWYCMKKGEVIRPRLFSCLLTVLTIMNFALGVLATLTRLACMLPFLFTVFLRLDKSLLDEEDVCWDFGTVTFLSTVGVCYRETNPIRRCFISTLMPNVNQLYGPVRSETQCHDKAAYESGERRYSKKYRNKLWLWAAMSKNPSLTNWRQQPSEEIANKSGSP